LSFLPRDCGNDGWSYPTNVFRQRETKRADRPRRRSIARNISRRGAGSPPSFRSRAMIRGHYPDFPALCRASTSAHVNRGQAFELKGVASRRPGIQRENRIGLEGFWPARGAALPSKLTRPYRGRRCAQTNFDFRRAFDTKPSALPFFPDSGAKKPLPHMIICRARYCRQVLLR